MKKVFIFGVLLFFLISFAYAQGNGIQAEKDNNTNKQITTSNFAKAYCLESGYKYENGTCIFKDNTECNAEEFYKGECEKNKTIFKSEAQKQKENKQNVVQEKTKEQNRLRIHADAECPNNCTCSGSTTKCWINGNREMTIIAGKSGNIIVQIKGENITTNVTLYKAEDGKLYRITKNNETREVKVLPEQIQEKIKEKIQVKVENGLIELDENGNYYVQVNKRAKFIGLFPVREKLRFEVNSETGELSRIRTSWWGFLVKDELDNILGSTCATVSPDSRDECCINQGFEYYKQDTMECLNK